MFLSRNSRPGIAVCTGFVILAIAATIPRQANAAGTYYTQMSDDYFITSYNCALIELYYGTDQSGYAAIAFDCTYYACVCAYYSNDDNPYVQQIYSYYAYYYGYYASYFFYYSIYLNTGDPYAYYSAFYNAYGYECALQAYYATLPYNPNLGYDPNAPTGSTVEYGSSGDSSGGGCNQCSGN